MRLQSIVGFAALYIVCAGARAAGQTNQDASERQFRQTTEIGISTSALLRTEAKGIGARIGIPMNDRVFFELGLEWMDLGRDQKRPDQVHWFYSLQARRLLRGATNASSRLFVTYGVAGWAERSATQTGLDTSFTLPVLPITGFGAEHLISKHLAVRGDVQLVWSFVEDFPLITPRIAGGVSMPIRGYR